MFTKVKTLGISAVAVAGTAISLAAVTATQANAAVHAKQRVAAASSSADNSGYVGPFDT